MERGRILYEQITGYFRGNHGYFQMTGQYAGHSRTPAESAGAVEIGKLGTAGIAGEIKCREQEALSRESESDRTQSEISSTEQTIAGIMQRIKEKARDRDERIRKLMERRQSFGAVGGFTGRERAVPLTAGTKGESDTDAFIRCAKLKSQIRSMQSTIAEQGQEIQKLNAHIARLAESDLVLGENEKLAEAKALNDSFDKRVMEKVSR